MLAIYKKELRSYFTSMMGYVFIAFFLIIIGIFYYLRHFVAAYANFEYSLSDITFVFVLLVPILTMRLMAEENRQKTDQLLYTSPLTAGGIVLGKFLAVFTILNIAMVIVCAYPLIIKQYGAVPLESAYASILGFSLLGGAYLAIGLYISSLTESQVVAAVVTFIVFLFTMFMEGIANVFPADKKTSFLVFTVIIVILCFVLYMMMHNIVLSIVVGVCAEGIMTVLYLVNSTLFDGLVTKVFGWLSVMSRYDSFYYGILDLGDVVYYISTIFLFLFLTTQVIKKKRWS